MAREDTPRIRGVLLIVLGVIILVLVIYLIIAIVHKGPTTTQGAPGSVSGEIAVAAAPGPVAAA